VQKCDISVMALSRQPDIFPDPVIVPMIKNEALPSVDQEHIRRNIMAGGFGPWPCLLDPRRCLPVQILE
jgi:hypothetical protein